MNRAMTVAAVVAVGWACNSGSATSAPEPRPAPHAGLADVAVGQLPGKPLYLALCRPCHGADGKGYAADHAPSLVNRTFLASASDDFLRRSIAMGRPGTSMAAYSKSRGGPLDDAAIDRLVGFLRDQGPTSPPPATDAKIALAIAAADPAIGAAIYATRCVACHGNAQTRGEAVSLANPQFQAAASDGFVRYAIANGRPGTKMEAFGGALSDAEIDGVVRYVRSLGGSARPAVQLLAEPTGKEPLVQNPSGRPASFTLRADPCPASPSPGGSAPPGCTPDLRFVSVDQVAKALAARQRIVIIDARPPSEWMRVHIVGAVSIPYHDLKRLDDMPRDGTWIVAYCACPHHLSGIVIDELRKRGYRHTAVLDEGINEWHRRGFPVVAADGVTKPLPEPAPGRIP